MPPTVRLYGYEAGPAGLDASMRIRINRIQTVSVMTQKF